MLLTLMAMQSIWQVWLAFQQRRQARKSLSELTEIGFTDSDRNLDPGASFWRSVLARYRKKVSLADQRRTRTRKAVARLSRASERKLARRYAPTLNVGTAVSGRKGRPA